MTYENRQTNRLQKKVWKKASMSMRLLCAVSAENTYQLYTPTNIIYFIYTILYIYFKCFFVLFARTMIDLFGCKLALFYLALSVFVSICFAVHFERNSPYTSLGTTARQYAFPRKGSLTLVVLQMFFTKKPSQTLSGKKEASKAKRISKLPRI